MQNHFSKRCVTTEPRFDFLKDLVADVPDLLGEFDDAPAADSAAAAGGGGSQQGGDSIDQESSIFLLTFRLEKRIDIP